MKSKSIFLMAVSLGFGLVAAIGITQVMGRSNEPAQVKEEPKLPILVAVQDIDINSELTPEMFVQEEWPARLVPEGVATALEDLEGMVTRARIGKKGNVMKSNLVDRNLHRNKKIPAGFKVIGLKLGAEDHLYGLLEAGDLVDIMAIFRSKSRTSSTGSSSRTFLRKVRIWSIGSRTSKDIEQNATAKGSTVVGLLVTEKQAEMIVLAQRVADLKMAMRGSEDGDKNSQSNGTAEGDLQDEQVNNDILADMMRNSEPKEAATSFIPVSAPAEQPKTTKMVIYSGTDRTTYTFNADASVIKADGFGQKPAPAPVTPAATAPAAGGESKIDFEDKDDDIDPDSLMDELDSEPGS